MASIKLLYNQNDVTAHIEPYLISIEYVDNTEGQSDELTIKLDNKDAYFDDAWYPEKGAILVAQIIQEDNSVLNCGTFQLDNVKISGSKGSGETITMKGLGAGILQTIRTKKSYAHENKTLAEIATTIAAKYGYTIKGDIPNVTILRRTQYRKTDLNFLAGLAAEYGVVFNIRNTVMVFTSIFTLESTQPILQLFKADVTDWDINDKTADTYLQAQSAYHNPQQKKVITGTSSNSDLTLGAAPKVDFIEIRSKTETQDQADLKSKAALYKANSLQREVNIQCYGDVLLVSGINIELPLTDWKKVCGIYHIIKSTHRIERGGGYTTSFDGKSVALIEQDKKQNTTS